MKKLLSIVVSISLVWGLFVAESSSATAKQKVEVRHISEDVWVDAPGYESQIPSSSAVTKYRTAGMRYNGDCFDIYPDAGLDPVLEHDQVGTTWYEYQQNGSMGRMISVTSNGYRHFSWMYTDHPYPPGPRFVDANRKGPAGGFLGQVHADGGDINAGYSNQTHLHDGTSVIVHNRLLYGGITTWGSALTMNEGVSGDSFPRHWDIPDYITGAPSGEPGIWPKAEVLYHETEDRDYIHIVLTERSSYGPHAVAYERCYLSAGDTLICQCCESGVPRTYKIASNVDGPGALAPIDCFDYSGDVSSAVTVSPVSHRVAVAYGRPACDETGAYHSDLCYVESMSNGDDWVDGTNWPPLIHNITNFGCTGSERVKFDLSACYDYEDSLHIVYVTCGFNPDQPGYYQPGVARLYHWCKQN
ncbi:MAG: hypothetical protein WBC88_12110, partial [Candidatus Zixiibacteriota bacterium]